MSITISPVPVPLAETYVKSMANVVPFGPVAGKIEKTVMLALP